jgi:CSLREA domain-containing protein
MRLKFLRARIRLKKVAKAQWRESYHFDLSKSINENSLDQNRLLISARISSQPGQALLAIDKTNPKWHLIEPAIGADKQRKISERIQAFDVTGSTVAILPMRLNEDALSDLVVLKDGDQRGLAVIRTEATNIYTVNSTGDGDDSNTADGICNDGNGNCTLRAAIEQANAGTGASMIRFKIGSGGQQTITLTSPLPAITQAVTIDGTTQSGFAGNPLMAVSGDFTGSSNITITAGNSLVRGIVTKTLLLQANGGNTIEGNYLGTDISGTTTADENAINLNIDTAPNNKIGGTTPTARNVIAGRLTLGYGASHQQR